MALGDNGGKSAPGPTDVLVAVETVAVNPVDTYVRSGRYRTPVPLPFIVGRDLIGTVAEVGFEVTGDLEPLRALVALAFTPRRYEPR